MGGQLVGPDDAHGVGLLPLRRPDHRSAHHHDLVELLDAGRDRWGDRQPSLRRGLGFAADGISNDQLRAGDYARVTGIEGHVLTVERQLSQSR